MTVAPAPTPVLDYANDEVERRYRHYRPRILLWSIVGYAMFYFVRKNLSSAMPVMKDQLDISMTSLGTFLTLHGVIYGISKFLNGIAGDRLSARWFMPLGLFLSAIVNIFFGLSSSVITLGIFWMLNGWVQGTGFPPCARLMTHWFSPKELATKMGIWNTSHCIGAALVGFTCAIALKVRYDWRMCFFVPAALAIATSGLLAIYLRDTPESVGLPPVAGTHQEKKKPLRSVLVQRVFRNRHIWVFCFASFFVYIVRYSIFDWGPMMLNKYKHTPLTSSLLIMGGFEGAGVLGAITAGWITDKFFAGRGARTCVFCMIAVAAVIFALWKLPPGRPWASTGLLVIAGFLVYAPQALVGISAANLATKEAAASAAGLAGFFAYASTTISGTGIGYLVDHYGWDRAFIAMLLAAACGTAMFLFNWNAPRDGYGSAAPA